MTVTNGVNTSGPVPFRKLNNIAPAAPLAMAAFNSVATSRVEYEWSPQASGGGLSPMRTGPP